MISTPYDFIAERFSGDRTGFRPRELGYLERLLDPVVPAGTVLDLGCGTGTPIAAHIASRGRRLVGVDGSEAMLAIARRQLPGHRWIHELMERVDFDETFDGAVCWDSLFHLPRRHHAPVIRKLHRWLAPGARLMVSSGGLVDESEGAAGFTDTMFGHEFYYDSLPPRQMVALMEETGFRILVAEMCDLPDGARNKGKWATVAEKI